MHHSPWDPPVSGPAGAKLESDSDPLLLARFAVPELPDGFVRRPRLLDLVTEGLRRPLLLVGGPAGAGKSLLVADWSVGAADRGAGPVAWLTVDGDDNTPGVWFAHLLQALRFADVQLPADLIAPATPARTGRSPLARLAAFLAARDGRPVTLVLDQFEQVTDADVAEELDFLLTYAASGLRVALVSRTEPLLPLHRYRARDRIAEICGHELEFLPSESGQLLQNLGLSLCDDAIRALTDRTRGWAAGLRLSALAAQQADNPEVYLKEFEAADTTTADFMLAEVFAAQSAEAQDLILRTSILEQTHVELAEALTGRQDAARLLEELAHANALIAPIGHQWYRHHPLFAEILRHRLHTREPDVERGLHQQAARWLYAAGRAAEALPHAAAAGDWKFAADRFVEGLSIGRLFLGLDTDRLRNLLSRMPSDVHGACPDLVRAALDLVHRDTGAAINHLRRAERGLVAGDEQIPAAELSRAFLRVLAAASTGSADEAKRSAAVFGSWERRAPLDLVSHHPEVRALVNFFLGSACLWQGRFDEARHAYVQAVEHSPDTTPTRPDAESHLALIDLLRGPFGRARSRAHAAILEAERHGLPSSCTRVAHLVLARIALERDDLTTARKDLEAAASASGPAIATDMGDPVMTAGVAVTRSRLLLADGDPAAALDVLPTEACAAPAQPPESGTPSPWASSELAEAASAALLARGDPAGAAAAAAPRAPHDPACAVALAHAQLAADRDPTALGSLDATASGDGRSTTVEVGAMLVRAEAAHCAGDDGVAVRRLAQALELARPEQLRRPFRENGPWLRSLLRAHESLARRHDWLPDELCSGQPRTVATDIRALDRLVLEPLSDREHEVLERAAEMMSTQEIADDLFLSVNTVKTHLKSINRKLCATRRAEAVRRAKQLRIL